MASVLCAALLLFGVLPTVAFAQPGPPGHWEGTVHLPNRQNQIAVDLAKDNQGVWIGIFAQPTLKVWNFPLREIKVDDKRVKFRLILFGASNVPTFDCGLENPALMSCTLTDYSLRGPVSVRMKRTGNAKVDLPKPSPAVTAELEGTWEGPLDTPAGTIPIVIHFKNQGRTVKATVDTPGPNSTQLPITDVVQSGSAIEFQSRITRARFKGVMNKESTSIAGEWSRPGASLPLTFKKLPSK